MSKIKTKMVYLTRVEHFNAAHRLFRADYTDEQNMEVFGKCSNPNWHGHNYEMHITVKGTPHPETGFVFNAKTLSTIVKEHVIDFIDHKNINLEVPFMQGKFATAELLCMSIFEILAPLLKDLGTELHCIKLYETPRIYVEYYGK